MQQVLAAKLYNERTNVHSRYPIAEHNLLWKATVLRTMPISRNIATRVIVLNISYP